MRKKVIKIMICLLVCLTSSRAFAAYNLNLSTTTVTVGETFTISASVSSVAAWGMYVNVSGPATQVSGITASADTTEDAKNGNKTITSTYKATGEGTITVRYTGDTTTETGNNQNISVTKTVSSKPKSNPTPIPAPSPTPVVIKSNNAKLRTLKVNIEGLEPNFNKNTTNYILTVDSSVSKLNMTIVPEHSKATYYITGNKNFAYGDNTLKIVVTAEDRKTTKTYNIIVTKAEDIGASNAYLSNIIIGNTNLTKEFNTNTLTYNLKEVESDIKSIDIKAFPLDAKATVNIIGNENLIEGENIIKIIVTAQDEKTKKTYTLKVNKKLAKVIESEETNNYVNPYGEFNFKENDMNNDFWNKYGASIRANASIILLYLLALVEFLQVVYLYRKLKLADPDYDKITIRRRKVILQQEKQQKEQEEIDENLLKMTAKEGNKLEDLVEKTLEEREKRRNNDD